MPQTILALLALAIVSMFSLNQRELTTAAQMNMIRNEIAVVGTGVAGEVFDHIGSFPFDGNGSVTRTTQLTQPANFGRVDSWDDARDIDDFHGHGRVFTVFTDHGSFDIDVSAEVHYVLNIDGEFVRTGQRTWLKEVTLKLEGPLGYRAELVRLYSYYDSDPDA